MSIPFRILLASVSLLTFIVVLRKIRKSQLQIERSLFWLISCFALVILSIFPQITEWAARILGIQSPSNLVFLAIIFVLMIELFRVNIQMSKFDDKFRKLVQNEALKDYEERNKEKSNDADTDVIEE